MNAPLFDDVAPTVPLAETSRRRLAALCTAQCRLATPLGEVLLMRTETGLAGVWFADQKHHPGELAVPENAEDALLRRAAHQLRTYFAGTSRHFDVPLDLQGTPFQRAVWQAMQGIPNGATCSYRDIADGLGASGALRAVGSAVGRNPVSVIVPCHRVIGSDGALTGYAGGLARKRALLALEHAAA